MSVLISVPDGSTTTDILTIEAANEALSAMRLSRIEKIDASDYLNSKLAWKLATLHQPLLYRMVSLAESFAVNWNAQNIVGAYLPARALIETNSLVLELENELRKLIASRDLDAIDYLLMNRLFATRDADWIADNPSAKAINILTLIDRLDRRDLIGVRKHYDEMSEVCHPNSLGHRLMYGDLDKNSGSTRYSNAWTRSYVHSLFATMVLIAIAKDAFDAIQNQIGEIASLQADIR